MKNYLLLNIVFHVILIVPRDSFGFLGRGTRLENNDKDLFGIFCSNFDKNQKVWHHQEITREAIKNIAIQYLKVFLFLMKIYFKS